jgi:hypothetical protein
MATNEAAGNNAIPDQQSQEGYDPYGLKPENIPGTPEYGVTKTEDSRSANDFVWSGVDSAIKSGDFSAIDAYYRGSRPTGTAEEKEDIAWRVVKHDRPKAEKDVARITDSLIPVARSIKETDMKGGVKSGIFGMDDQSLTDFITSADLPQDTKFEVIRELTDKTYRKTKEFLGTSLVPGIRKSLLQLDDKYSYGELVYAESQKGSRFIDGLSADQQVEAFKAMSYYKSRQPGGGIGGAITAGFQLGEEFVNATAGALAGLADLTNFTAENRPEYFSQAYRNNPEKLKRAETVMASAGPAISRPLQAIQRAMASGDGKLVQTLIDQYTDLNNPSNEEFMAALTQLALLREDGAFAKGSYGEKLSSFGSGVANSAVAFKHFVSDSTDPNSFLFMREHNQQISNEQKGGIVKPSVDALVSQFRDSDAYWASQSKESILKAVSIWKSNLDNIASANQNAISRAYEAVGMEDTARIAETAYGDKRVEAAATASYDPITIVVGGARLLKLAGKGGAALPKIGELSEEGKALTAEAKAIASEVVKTNESLTPIAERVKASFKQATGREITNEEALALIVSGQTTGLPASLADEVTKIVGETISTNEAVAGRIEALQVKVKAYADKVSGGIEPTPSRPVSGAVVGAIAAAAEGTGRGVKRLGEAINSGSASRTVWRRGVNYILANQSPLVSRAVGFTALGGAVGSGAYYFDYDGINSALGGGIVAGGLLSASYLITGKNLVASGSWMENLGAVNRRVAKAMSSGEYVMSSPFQTAIRDVRKEIILAETNANPAVMEKLTNELKSLQLMVNSGYEQAVRAGFHVVVDDIIQGGTTGSIMAFANDRSMAAYGFGMGATSSVGMRAMSRLAVTPHANEIARSKESVAELIAIDQSLAPDQSARLRQWLDGSKDYTEFVERADSYRKAWNFSGGRIILSNAAESATVGVTYNLPEAEINRIRAKANAEHPGDPTAAAAMADAEVASVRNRIQDKVNYDAATQLLADSNRKVEASNNKIQKLTDNITATKEALKQSGKTTSSSLLRMENDLANEQNALKLALAENVQISAKHGELAVRVDTSVNWRQYETRQTANGTNMRQVMDGMYVDDTGYIHINIEQADRLTMVHEAFEAILKDDAVTPLVKDMNDALWSKQDSGKRRISNIARDALFEAYKSSLTPENAKAYQEGIDKGLAEYGKNGSTAGLERYTREALSWWMATIDTEARGVGYGGTGQPKGLTNVRGEGFGDILKRVTVGERTMWDFLNTDNLRSEFAAFFDPNIGILPRQFAGNVVSNMREAGMRFVAQSDGTVRGFFLNNRGEIVRDPMMVKMYEAVYRLTGGKGSPRLSNAPVESLTQQQKADIFRATGLDWFLDDQGNPLPDPSAPVPTPAAGTTGGGAAPTPVRPAGGTPAPGTPTVRDVMNTHGELIITALKSVGKDNRGLVFGRDIAGEGERDVIYGKPTQAEIDAILRIQSLPQTVKDNMVTILKAMQLDGDRPILSAKYANVFSRNKSASTENRNYISRDYGFVSDRNFAIVGFEFNNVYYTADGKKSISEVQWQKLDPAGQANYSKKISLRAKVFDIDAYQDQTNRAFTEGLRLKDKDGKPTGYLKDGSGKDLTAARMRELFFDDNEFHNKANLWLNHYIDGGPIDPTSVEKPGGKIVEPSAKILGDGNDALGEARLVALRAIHGMTVRKGRVVVNQTTFTTEAVRGLEYTFMDMDISSMGQIRDSGRTTNVTQEAVTRGQFNMAPAKWEARSLDVANKFRPSDALNETTGLWTHPTLRDTYVLETRGGGVTQYEIYVEGENVPNLAKNFKEATNAAREKLKVAEDMEYARQIATREVRAIAEIEAREKAKADKARTAQEKKAAMDRIKATDVAMDKAQSNLDKAQRKLDLEIREVERREAKAQLDFEEAQKKDAATAQKAGEDLAKIKSDLEAERARINQQLKDEITQRGQMDADAIANALKTSSTTLDFAALATKALLVPRESLPIAIVNRPLVVTRVYNSTGAPAKRVVTNPTEIVPQQGAGPTAGAGEVAAGQALGSEAFKTGVSTIDRYLRSPTEAIQAINRSVDSVWKTELGNQLVQVYNGLDAKGKPSYRYHLYGANGMELYTTTKLEDIYRAMAINEHRLRNTQSTVQGKPNVQDLARGELERMLAGKQTYFQSQGYVGGRAEEQERERKRQETLAGKYSR